MIVVRKAYFKCPGIARRETDYVVVKILEHAGLAQHHANILTFTALELDTADFAHKINGGSVPGGSGPCNPFEARPLPAHDRQRFVDVGLADARHRPPDRNVADVAQPNLRVYLKGHAEFDLGCTPPGSLGLEARVTRKPEVLGAHYVMQVFLQRVAQHLTPHLILVLPGDDFE